MKRPAFFCKVFFDDKGCDKGLESENACGLDARA